ncbi:MAG: SpoIID/LytB domain-containing protein [Verrucomicrobia bacterium]|nr:SpoIID/LytB domain-containing protein [Verrucomicrobiota bacterium]
MKRMKALIAASLVACTIAPVFVRAGGVEIPTDISQKTKPATIKVLIGKQHDKVLLEAKGRFKVFNPLTGLPLTDGISTKRNWISSSDNGLVWGEVIPGMHQIRVVPSDAQSTLLVDGIEYRGCVEIYDIKGKLHVVNEVDIERYLKSIMTAQFTTEMDEEVMDAIAITARTNAYYLVNRKPSAYWHVEASEVGYQGYAVTLQNLHVDRAIDNTRHMVMTYQGEPFPTAWTKDSAGKTADFATVYRKDVKTPAGVEAGFAAHEREKHAWTFSISKQDLAKALGAVKVSEFDLYQDAKSQKVYGARLKEGNETRQFDFTKLQTALGNARLKSNDFTVQLAGDKIVFKGFGEGTGVGLCLFSASAMADKGEKAPKILASFFPETKLENIRSFDEKHKMLVSDTSTGLEQR